MIHSQFQNDNDDDKWTTKETNQAIYQFRDEYEDEEKQKEQDWRSSAECFLNDFWFTKRV